MQFSSILQPVLILENKLMFSAVIDMGIQQNLLHNKPTNA